MKKSVINIPNVLCFVRILLLPILFYLLVFEKKFIFLMLLVIAGLTDILDGFIARKLKQETAFGAQLDSIADYLYYVSFVVWFWMITKEVLFGYLQFFVGTFVVLVLVYVIMIVRFRKIVFLHLYSSKIAAIVTYVCFVYSFFDVSETLILVVLIVWTISVLEMLVVVLKLKKAKQNVGSLLVLK